jgi:carboxyl-terminal processing protease
MRTLSHIQTILCLAALLALGCRGPEKKSAEEHQPPALALETFDEVWRILNETHFDTNFNGQDWNVVRAKYRPKIEAAYSQREAREVIEGMLKLLDVSHLALVPGDLIDPVDTASKNNATVEEADEEQSGTVGMVVRYSGNDLVVTRVEPRLAAAESGVQPGWIIRRIGGRSTREYKKKAPSTLDERRQNFLAWRSASRKLSGEPGSEVEVEFQTGEDRTATYKLQRTTARGEPLQFGTLPVLYTELTSEKISEGTASIGLIRFNIWMLPTALAFHRAIDEHRQREGIIIDLRGNIGGVVGMIIGVAGHFVKQPLVLGSIVMRDNTLKLPANPRFADATGKRAEPYAGPVAILVDEITASASEVFAGGLQEHGRVRVFGRTTAGQALPALFHNLPNGDVLYHPMADFITPKGTRFEGRGVIPDEIVPLDRKTLLRGIDADFEAAKRWIASHNGGRQ